MGREPTEEEVDLCINHKADAEQKLGRSFRDWKPYAVQTQVVAGMSFTFAVDVGGTEAVLIRIFQPLPHTGNPTQMSSCELRPAGFQL